MPDIEIFQIDAFTDKVFHGNPTAVCILHEWLNDELLQAIAVENNLAETAFIIAENKQFHLRWFTPKGEINSCSHATLAAGFVVLELGLRPHDTVIFSSLSGEIVVRKKGLRYVLELACLDYYPCRVPELLLNLIDKPFLEAYESEFDYLIVLADETTVLQTQTNVKALAKLPKNGLIITAPGNDVDFCSRYFYPKRYALTIPNSASAHCILAPFWATRLDKTSLHAIQGTLRKSEIYCEIQKTHLYISGHCKWYSKGYLVI